MWTRPQNLCDALILLQFVCFRTADLKSPHLQATYTTPAAPVKAAAGLWRVDTRSSGFFTCL